MFSPFSGVMVSRVMHMSKLKNTYTLNVCNFIFNQVYLNKAKYLSQIKVELYEEKGVGRSTVLPLPLKRELFFELLCAMFYLCYLF